jgi:isoleucyl-tRNA synthetase
VQNARKEAGLEITDRISLGLDGDEELVAAARAHEPYVAGETLATSVRFGSGAADGAAAVKVGGRELRVAVERA